MARDHNNDTWRGFYDVIIIALPKDSNTQAYL